MTVHESFTAGDPSNSFERYGLRLVEERPPTWMGKHATVRVTPLLPESSPSVADRLVALGFAAFWLAHLAGIVVGLCWALWWLVSA